MAYIRSKVKDIEFVGVGGPFNEKTRVKVIFRLFKSFFTMDVFQVIPNIPKVNFFKI